MIHLIDDPLGVSRVTRGKIELKMERTTLDHIVEHAVEIIRPLLDERNHALNMNLPAHSVALHGNPERLAQVLANLLHNAAKYTDPGGCISLSAHEQSDNLILVVADNGIVLNKAVQEKTFDLFVQDAPLAIFFACLFLLLRGVFTQPARAVPIGILDGLWWPSAGRLPLQKVKNFGQLVADRNGIQFQ